VGVPDPVNESCLTLNPISTCAPSNKLDAIDEKSIINLALFIVVLVVGSIV